MAGAAPEAIASDHPLMASNYADEGGVYIRVTTYAEIKL
jgi:hypothetical protein